MTGASPVTTIDAYASLRDIVVTGLAPVMLLLLLAFYMLEKFIGTVSKAKLLYQVAVS
jgi:sorbitol-specific phosphotransferase system component IIC